MNTTCICILNYNNGLKTTRCISAVLNQTLQNYRVIIIDNRSTDDSISVIQEFLEKNKLKYRLAEHDNKSWDSLSCPDEILLVRSDRNGGYSTGNNIGIRLAKSVNIFSNILIINNDVELGENFLEEMVKRFEDLRKHYRTGRIALGAIELGVDGKIRHTGFHYLHLLSGIVFSSPVFPSLRYIVGSCIFTGIDAPLLDESFFLYFDDTQYSKILLRNGYILENSPGSFFIHEKERRFNLGLQWQIFKSLVHFYRLRYPFLLPVVVPIRLLLLLYLRLKSMMQAKGFTQSQ